MVRSSQTVWQEFILPIAVGFFDETTDEDLGGFTYTVAGFIANNHASACLELKWNDLLKQYSLQYFKASELSAGEGQFRQYRDEPDREDRRLFSEMEKRKFAEIHTAFTDLIVEFSEEIHGIGAVVILPDYEKIMREYPPARKTLSYHYYLASQVVLIESGTQCAILNRDRPKHSHVYLRPVFDSHEIYSGRMKQTFDSFREKNPISAKSLLCPHYENDRDYLSLQVADNIAYELRRTVLASLTNQKRIRRSFERIKPMFLRAYKLDYPSLKAIADNNDPDSIPIDPMDYTLQDILRDGE